MPGKRFKSADSVRDQYTQQRSGGSHFANSGNARQVQTSQQQPQQPQVKSLKLPQVAAQSNKAMTSQTFATAHSLDSAMIPRVAEKNEPSGRRSISGASGVLPKIPGGKAVKNKGYSRYSNGYFDRPDAKQLSDVVAQFQTEPVEGAPAYSWFPFAIYGAVAAVASVVWAVLSIVFGLTPMKGACMGMTAGLVVLAGIVLAGALVAVLTTVWTKKLGQFDTMDVVASAIGKTALMMLAAIIVWIVCGAIVS